MTCTQYLELCDLRDNDIGDLAARELMDGLTDRGTGTGIISLMSY